MVPFPDESTLLAKPEKSPDEASSADTASPASRLPLAGGILFAVVAEAFLLLALTISRGAQLELVEVGVPLMSGLFALGSCLLVSMALQRRERGAWVLLGLACLGTLVAEGTHFLPLSGKINLASAQAASYPSLASVALIMQSIGFFLAFLLFPPPTRSKSVLARLGRFFDGVVVVGAALVVLIYFVLVPMVQEGSGLLTPAHETTLALCLGDLLLLGALTYALRTVSLRDGSLFGALSILGVAMLLLVGADFVNMVQTPHQLAPIDSPLQAVWNAGYLGIGLGALLRLRSGGYKASAEAGIDIQSPEGFNIWLALPFVLTVVAAASIVVHALTRADTPTEMLVALICACLLLALVGVRHLVGLVEARQMAEQRRALEQEVKLAEQEVEKLGSARLAQARARRDSLSYVLDALTRFGYGDYQARVGVLERELTPLAEQVNTLLDGIERQLNDRDRGRETRLVHILTDALGRLALGELHDLPELPTPGGSPLDGLMMSVVQVRNRLISLQGSVHQYEQERHAAQQELERARLELERETQSQRTMAQEMTQNLSDQLYSERQVAQATEEQWQRERQRMLAQMQAAETRVTELETLLRNAEQRLVDERLEAEQRLKATPSHPEILPLEAPQPDPAQLAQIREQSEYLISQFLLQAERLHGTAATLQTAAEVAQRLARTIHETAALPELQGASAPATPAAAAQIVTAPPASQTLSALQMLERMASGKPPETRPRMPAVIPASSEGSGPQASRSASGPLDESAHGRIRGRLQGAAARTEEIASGLLDLAKQCIQAGDESARAAQEAEHLTVGLEPVKAPSLLRRSPAPTRAPKTGR